MTLVLGLDLGTTTITALAVDIASGAIVGRSTLANDAEITREDDKPRGWSEWDAAQIATVAVRSLRDLAERVGPPILEAAALGLTGQQHGVVLVDERFAPLGPLINWQDRRVEELNPHTGVAWLDEIRSRIGADARLRTGCTISAGYMGATLFWLKSQGMLPGGARALFLVDFMAALLTGQGPLTDPTSAASSGLFDVRAGAWDGEILASLGLPVDLFTEVGRAGDLQGPLRAEFAAQAGLPRGLPVCIGLGDNQASVYGSVADLDETVLVNVGTGGQVTAYTDRFLSAPNLETRPFPGGYLLVNAGLCGGRTYALLERFFHQVCAALAGHSAGAPLFNAMNRLATAIPPGCEGMKCQPLFTGTRHDPDLCGAFTGISAVNFSPGHLTRALLEGMAAVFHEGYLHIERLLGAPRTLLVGAGNGLRQNALLAEIVAAQFGRPMLFPQHYEEAAFGAALIAAVGLGLLPDRPTAARLIDYDGGALVDRTRSARR